MFKLHFVQLMNINILLLSLKDVKIKYDYSLYFDHCFYMTIFIYKNMTTKKKPSFFPTNIISETKNKQAMRNDKYLPIKNILFCIG